MGRLRPCLFNIQPQSYLNEFTSRYDSFFGALTHNFEIAIFQVELAQCDDSY